MLPTIVLKDLLPVCMQPSTMLADATAKLFIDSIRNQKGGVLFPTIGALGEAYFFLAESVAVGGRRALLVGRAVTDDAVDDDERRPILCPPKEFQSVGNRFRVIGVTHPRDVPSISFEP